MSQVSACQGRGTACIRLRNRSGSVEPVHLDAHLDGINKRGRRDLAIEMPNLACDDLTSLPWNLPKPRRFEPRCGPNHP